jgi:membrane-associated phospholipid phosphatase
VRRRAKLPPAVVLGASGLAAPVLCVVMPRNRVRDVAVCALNMWAYIAAYELPHDDAERQASRTRVRYPIIADRILGLGTVPTVRLQRAFARPGTVNRFERVLVWCHWLWFLTPHCSVAYVLIRRPERFAAAAARMYTVFDLGAIFYWVIPTAPPWWASARGELGDAATADVRRMMIEYGPEFWGDLWGPLYDVLGGNPVAAMPSLHFATTLMGAHLLTEVDPVAGAVGWTYLTGLGIALVYLGEHYLVDLIAGAAFTEAIRAAAPRATPPARRVARLIGGLQALAAGA